MDFHIATPDDDVYLFSEERGRTFCLLTPPPIGKAPAPAPALPDEPVQQC